MIKQDFPTTTTSRICLAVALFFLVFNWIFAFLFWKIDPSVIPTHFNLQGQPDSLGDSKSYFLIAGISTLVFFLIWIFSRFPQFCSLPFKWDEDNFELQCSLMSELIIETSLIVNLIFMMAILIIHFSSQGGKALFLIYGLYFLLLWLFVTIIIGFIKVKRAAKTGR